jgi:hypothetical protein
MRSVISLVAAHFVVTDIVSLMAGGRTEAVGPN